VTKLSKKEQELLDSLGIKIKPEDYITPIEEQAPTKEMAKWEAQSVLVSLNWPYPEMVPVTCWSCKKVFLTNYKANVYCSMECFKIELEKKGLVWRPERSFYEQWGNLEPPLMIPPEAIKAMRRLLSLVDQETIAQSHSPEPDYAEEHIADEDDALPDLQVPYNDPDIPEEPLEDQDSFLALLASLDD
jgi:hypothetical protein